MRSGNRFRRSMGGSRAVTAGQRATAALLKATAAAASGANPVELADMASPPTITQASTTDATLASPVYPAVTPSSFLLTSAKAWRRTINNRLYQTHSTVSPGTGSLRASFPTAGQMSPEVPNPSGDTANNFAVSFVTASAVVEIELQVSTAVQPYRIIVDNQYAARDGIAIDAAGKTFTKLTFAGSVSRTITIEAQSGHLVGGIRVSSGETVTAPPAKPKAVITGDSFSEALNVGTYSGVTRFWQWDGLGSVFAAMIGANLRNAAIGGTGYWNQSGGIPGTRSNIVTQMDYWVQDDRYDLILFAGGYNDAGQTTDANLRALARQAWQKARLFQPNALIVVFGIWGGRTVSSDSSVRVVSEAALKAEFNNWADPFSIFIPVSPSFADAWMNGTGYEGATNGTGNSDLYVSTDATHPNRAGHLYLGDRMNTAYRAALSALTARIGA